MPSSTGAQPHIARRPGRFGRLRVQQLVLLEVALAVVAGSWVLAPGARGPAVAVAVLLLPWLYVGQHRPLAAQLAQIRALGRRRRSASTVARLAGTQITGPQTIGPQSIGTQSGSCGATGQAAIDRARFAPLQECDPALRTLTHRDRDDRVIGLVGDGSFLTAVLAIAAPDRPLRPAGAQQSIDLALLHHALRTDNVVLESAQILQYTRPSPAPHLPPHSAAHRSYHQLKSGGWAPPAVRRSWIALKFDPERCSEAVRVRGGGLLGAQRCVVLAADRLARSLTELGFEAQLLDESGLVSALGTALCVSSRTDDGEAGGASAGRQRSNETALDWRCDDRWHSVFWLGQWPALTPGALPALAQHLTSLPALATVLSVTVTEGSGGGAEVSAYLRLVARGADELDRLRGQLKASARHSRTPLVHLDREQVPGVLATLPLGGTR